ncbi:AAA family ATPase [[Clostridium] symbiosum]|uniref:AAA family ATPase n=1 Tax=Clostridium symbiosum TaxID=1512 RepID=UPI00210EF830|nr:AAA family ATPase [[Clostridium] symbiosum]MCQ4835728.1 AAA family ATPase [[Clostridium] symbiosum]
MIIKSIEIEKFRAFENVSFCLGRRITAIAGRNATQKTTVLGMIGQPFTISKGHPMYGCKTIDGYNFRSQFKEKFKISPEHDQIGQHKWKLNLHTGVYENTYYSVESIARRLRNQEPTLRFWNAESRASGAGYVQLPVYFLSLSRLFPIGETGKTQAVASTLSSEELEYCIINYRTILSIQNTEGVVSVGIEKGASAKTFAGISDQTHDIFTNSAGEGNIMRIILAVLSFKRLQEEYKGDYKGGILLIDELDATLYGFSQKKLIDYLWNAAKESKIQIVFTTHSPVILKSVNKYQRREYQEKGINLPAFAYDSSIVYLEPKYIDGKRTIMPRNIFSNSDLNTVMNDINLMVLGGNKINIYCEDMRASIFLQYMLSNALGINLELYMSFVDINLGWTNYVQLYEKKVPEFKNNIIVLDGDVPSKQEFRSKARTINEAGNFLFLPLVIEKDLFVLLKEYNKFAEFQENYSCVAAFNYDICFNEWPLDSNQYVTLDYKAWFKHIESILGDQTILYRFWCDNNQQQAEEFVVNFIEKFNVLAERKEVDALPPIEIVHENNLQGEEP